LPLAIRATGSTLDVTIDLDPSDYVTQLNDERTRLERIGVDPLIGVDVQASFNLSYARLTPDATRVFRRLAVFPASFDARAEEKICEDPGHKHLSELLRRNLVIYNEDTQRYRLHDLARLFAVSRMSEDEGHATRMYHSAHYLTVLGECDDLYLKGGEAIKSGMALFDAERRNIEAGQEWACHYVKGDGAAAGLCNKYPNAGVYVLYLRQHPRESISWLESALAAARQLKDRAFEGRHLGSLGSAHTAVGEMDEAIELFNQQLAIARETGDRNAEGSALGNLGSANLVIGEIRHAIDLFEQALTIFREFNDRRAEEMVLGNLGIAYKNLGETQRAIEFHEKRLVIAREIGDRYGEGQTLGNLGNAYFTIGQTRYAKEFYEQGLIITREIGDRFGEGSMLLNIGLALNELGDRVEGIAHAEAALEIYEQIESPHAERAHAVIARWRGEA
jgi:tetratricopeptide (TPR) repeat protein